MHTFTYDIKLPFEIRTTRPDMKYYLLLDRQPKGCSSGLRQAAVYIRQSLMINNPTFHDILMRLGVRQISDMEVLSCVIYQVYGEDNRYYGESDDDTPVFELIKSYHTQEEHCSCQPESEEEQHHVNNDLTAAVMRDMQYGEEQIHIYEELIRYIQDNGADEALSYLLNNAKKAMDTSRNLPHTPTTYTEIKDLGEEDTHNAWDLDISNYFDKPNPTLVNSSDIEDFPFKRQYLPIQKKAGYTLKANSRYTPIALQDVLLLYILDGYTKGYIGIGDSSLFSPLQLVYVTLPICCVNDMLFLYNKDR